MSINGFNTALDFMPSGLARSSRGRQLLGTIVMVFRALRDGLAASREYHKLTVRGVPHAKAAKIVVDRHFN